MQSEHDIQNSIRLELSKHGYYTERINVGSGYLIDKKLMNQIKALCPQLRDQLNKVPYFSTGAVKGRSDLSAIKNGRISFLEVKNEIGKPSADQLHFIERMQQLGCRAGIVRSAEDALALVEPLCWGERCGNSVCPACGFECGDDYYLGKAKACPNCGEPLRSEYDV